MSLLDANRTKWPFLEDFWPAKTLFSSIFLIEVIVMDKNIVKELGKETLIKIILRLYETSKNDYAYYQKKRKELEEERNIREADNTNGYSYAFNFIVEEIEKAVRFEIIKLKRLQSVHRPVLKLLREKFGIKNKKEFLSMSHKELVNLAYECESCEYYDRLWKDNDMDITHPGVLAYIYLNNQFELGLKELRKIRRKRKRAPRKITINEETLYKLSPEALAGILVDLYDNCVYIYGFHNRNKQECLEKDSIRQYEYEMNFCDGFFAVYTTIESSCKKR